jgi:hypothetical protein
VAVTGEEVVGTPGILPGPVAAATMGVLTGPGEAAACAIGVGMATAAVAVRKPTGRLNPAIPAGTPAGADDTPLLGEATRAGVTATGEGTIGEGGEPEAETATRTAGEAGIAGWAKPVS